MVHIQVTDAGKVREFSSAGIENAGRPEPVIFRRIADGDPAVWRDGAGREVRNEP
jgi:hypothetical protein